jgi:hypothetical protein
MIRKNKSETLSSAEQMHRSKKIDRRHLTEAGFVMMMLVGRRLMPKIETKVERSIVPSKIEAGN